ncbi:MAG TPA: hypothetical protein VGB56_00390 [Flavisolibacter sp.]
MDTTPSQGTPAQQQPSPEQKFERFKYYVDLAKWFIVSVALVVMTTIIDAGFRDRSAGLSEIQQYDKYVTELIVLNEEVGPRRLLAQYFANVTASDKLRKQWQAYYKLLDGEYTVLMRARQEGIRARDSLTMLAILSQNKSEKADSVTKLQITRLDSAIETYTKTLHTPVRLPASLRTIRLDSSIRNK